MGSVMVQCRPDIGWGDIRMKRGSEMKWKNKVEVKLVHKD